MNTQDRTYKIVSQFALKALLFTAIAFALFGSCQKPNDEIFTEKTELTRFMENNLDAQEFFEPTIFPSNTALLDSSDISLRQLSLIDQERTPYQIWVTGPHELDNYGNIFVARVTMNDKFVGEYLQRLEGFGDLQKEWRSTLPRGALFFKLGNDNAPYLGWEFVGYNTGRPLSETSQDVTIKSYPAFGGLPRTISNIPIDSLIGSKGTYTLRMHLPFVNEGERVEIISFRKKFNIYARTASGFRQLEAQPISLGRYKYTFTAPPADPLGRFFHLLTFQEAPLITIDSIFSVTYDTLIIGIKFPPDTIFDTTFQGFLIFDTIVYDTTVVPPILEVDTIIGQNVLAVDTTLDSFLIEVTENSVLSDTVHYFDEGDIWTFPYSVR